jgi:osmotically-inducible protein OsmY
MRTVLCLAVSLAVLAGCNPQDRTDLAKDASQLGKTASRAAANATVSGKVEAALALRKGVDTKALHISATGPVVTIAGTVDTTAKKKTILDIATNTVGVDTVIDQIKVVPAKATNTDPAASGALLKGY